MIWWLLFACIEPADRDVRTPHWVDVDIAGTGVCAVREDGTARCWSTSYQEEVKQLIDLESVVMFGGGACFGVQSGEQVCLGGPFDDGSFHAGPYDGVALAGDGACGWTDQGVTCWGSDRYDERIAELPTGLRDLVIGDAVCGVTGDGGFLCPGFSNGKPVPDPQVPDLEGVDVAEVFTSGDGEYNCVLATDGEVWCSPTSFTFANERWEFARFEGRLASADVVAPLGDRLAACGINDEGTLACLGDPPDEMTPAPEGTYTKVATGGDGGSTKAVALSAEGHLVEWLNVVLICDTCRDGYGD